MNVVNGAELKQLHDVVVDVLGFGLERDRLEQLGVAVLGRAHQFGLPGLAGYIERLQSVQHRAHEISVLAELVTVTETFFFRNVDQINAFVETIAKLRQHSDLRRLRILSMGCASGEEPYTLAIAVREAFPDLKEIQIIGADVNRKMLEKAARARYSSWSLRATSAELIQRYFERVGDEYQLRDPIRNMVEFRELNLADPGAWSVDGLLADTIFCRNVIMYFAPEVMRRVVERLSDMLVPSGYLFLGHAETLRGLSHQYQLCHTHGTFYYQKRSEFCAPLSNESPHSISQLGVNSLSEVVPDTMSWFDAIQQATRRVTELANSHGTGRAVRSVTHPLPQASSLTRLTEVIELMRNERFSEALTLLEALPLEATAHPDGLLLAGVLLTNHGKITEAESTCGRLLALDDLNAGAHYLKALCREHAGDHQGAVEHDRVAVHLDPTFAMPYLHLGLLAKREQDWSSMRRALARALVLLEREDLSRLVLFGGGFSREALTTLCRTELVRAEQRG